MVGLLYASSNRVLVVIAIRGAVEVVLGSQSTALASSRILSNDLKHQSRSGLDPARTTGP
jgi:hypothetical protein